MRAFSKKVDIAGLKIDEHLASVVEKDIAPGTGIDAKAFWASFAQAVKEFGPRTKQMLDKRDLLQTKIDAWHQARKGKPVDMTEYKAFLQSIG
jgi:malate synthase